MAQVWVKIFPAIIIAPLNFIHVEMDPFTIGLIN